MIREPSTGAAPVPRQAARRRRTPLVLAVVLGALGIYVERRLLSRYAGSRAETHLLLALAFLLAIIVFISKLIRVSAPRPAGRERGAAT